MRGSTAELSPMRSTPVFCGMYRAMKTRIQMGKLLDTRLIEQDRLALEQLVRKSPDWRALERAKNLLLLCQPMLSREVAKVQNLNICTVRETWKRWLSEGMKCLCDKPRSGAPSKHDQAVFDRQLQWAREQPLTATQLLQRHVATLGRIL